MGERPKVYGPLGLLAWAAVAPSLLPTGRVYWVLGTVATSSWLLGTREWRSLGSWRTWLFVASLAALGVVTARWSGMMPTGYGGLALGLHMAARALAILLAVDTLAAHVPVAELAALGEGLGLRGLGFAVGVACNMLPILRRTAANAWGALRLRAGPGRRPWLALRRLAVTVLALTLGRAQAIVDAAEARAYSPGAAPASPPRWQRQDAVLALALAAWTVVLAIA